MEIVGDGEETRTETFPQTEPVLWPPILPVCVSGMRYKSIIRSLG